MPTGQTKTMRLDPAGAPTPPPWTPHETQTRLAIKAGKRVTICYIQMGPQERENAALICAAHQLREACEQAEYWLEESKQSDQVQPVEILRVLRAAIDQSRKLQP